MVNHSRVVVQHEGMSCGCMVDGRVCVSGGGGGCGRRCVSKNSLKLLSCRNMTVLSQWPRARAEKHQEILNEDRHVWKFLFCGQQFCLNEGWNSIKGEFPSKATMKLRKQWGNLPETGEGLCCVQTHSRAEACMLTEWNGLEVILGEACRSSSVQRLQTARKKLQIKMNTCPRAPESPAWFCPCVEVQAYCSVSKLNINLWVEQELLLWNTSGFLNLLRRQLTEQRKKLLLNPCDWPKYKPQWIFKPSLQDDVQRLIIKPPKTQFLYFKVHPWEGHFCYYRLSSQLCGATWLSGKSSSNQRKAFISLYCSKEFSPAFVLYRETLKIQWKWCFCSILLMEKKIQWK